MSSKPITLVLSDLHVGGGPADPGDDHIYFNNQLVHFLAEQLRTDEGSRGDIEVIFNGDFLEFAQTNPSAFAHLSDDRWCTESESCVKLETIIDGHPEIFGALRIFQSTGNRVTIAAGNHDVDLYWASVQARLRAVAGSDLNFDLGKVWIERYDGQLQIAHGHMDDVVNKFVNWEHPFVTADWGVECLEMCLGTLFMVKFVNHLEAQYPFADNLLPVTKLGRVLYDDDKSGFVAVGWILTKFGATSPSSLGPEAEESDYGSRLLRQILGSATRRNALVARLTAQELEQERRQLAEGSLTSRGLTKIMLALLGDRGLEMSTWTSLFTLNDSAASLGGDSVTLASVVKARNIDMKEELRRVARNRGLETNAAVVILGHSHEHDTMVFGTTSYYNPGSWTRYLKLEPNSRVKLNDLKDESRYPYALNVIRVELDGGELASRVLIVEESAGSVSVTQSIR